MQQAVERPRRIKQSVSFRPDQFTALKEQAERERHGNLSLIVQRAVDRELERCESAADALPSMPELVTA